MLLAIFILLALDALANDLPWPLPSLPSPVLHSLPIQLGGAFSILSSCYGLGVYSFIVFDFNPYRSDQNSDRLFLLFTGVGLLLVSAVFFLYASFIRQISTYTQFLTLVEVLISSRLYERLPSAQIFLVMFFFFLVLKCPLQIMLVKRAIFELCL